ncbi:MAG: TrkA family potassium uptake protein [Clostridium sp.]|nr:TrkA family potassium uptake protein [Clostridium sp.]
MRFLIIGLGIYGSNLATDLTQLGHEVIGADARSSIVETIKDFISTAYIIDSTDESALSALPLKNIDIVIVAIGENFGASIKTVALLKKLKVGRIYARAIDPLHESILQGIGVTRILKPEQRAAFDLVNEMALGPDVDALRVDQNNYILKFEAPAVFENIAYKSLDLKKDYGLQLIAATRQRTKRNVIGVEQPASQLLDLDGADSEARVQSGDIWTCFGQLRDYHRIEPSK